MLLYPFLASIQMIIARLLCVYFYNINLFLDWQLHEGRDQFNGLSSSKVELQGPSLRDRAVSKPGEIPRSPQSRLCTTGCSPAEAQTLTLTLFGAKTRVHSSK